MACKDKCRNERSGSRLSYDNGHKRCTTCDKFIETNELRCYCCNSVFRDRVQSSISRKKRIEMVVRY